MREDAKHEIELCAHCRSHLAAGAHKEYTIFFVPYKTVLCERALEARSNALASRTV